MRRPTQKQMLVFVRIDNCMSVNDVPSPTIGRMQSRGWLDGLTITKKGYEVFDKYRNGRPATAK